MPLRVSLYLFPPPCIRRSDQERGTPFFVTLPTQLKKKLEKTGNDTNHYLYSVPFVLLVQSSELIMTKKKKYESLKDQKIYYLDKTVSDCSYVK